MIKKVTSIEEAISELELLDSKLESKSEDLDYVIASLENRKVLISQIYQLKSETPLNKNEKERLERLYKRTNKSLSGFNKNKEAIEKRLSAHSKTLTLNKNFAY